MKAKVAQTFAAIAIASSFVENGNALSFIDSQENACNLTLGAEAHNQILESEINTTALPAFETQNGLILISQANATCNSIGYSPSNLAAPSNVVYREQTLGWMVYILDGTEDDQCIVGDYVTPLFHTEILWGKRSRAIFYFVLMMWCFLGIAIISDHFMAAIEVITSKERIIVIQNDDGEAEERKVLVWDETVANLTLMALGSSAPEILLSVIETLNGLGKPQPEEGLGPATIVGSAAFNLLCISAVCVGAIPNGEKKVIEGYGVFLITSTFSVFAYIWIYIVLSDDLVNLWEAIVTFCLFPLLVFLSYAQNNQKFGSCGSVGGKVRPDGGHIIAIDGENHKHIGARKTSSGRLVNLDEREKQKIAEIIQQLPDGISEEDMARIAADGLMKVKPSTMRYRIDARRKLAGGRGIIQKNINIIKRHTIQRFSRVDFPGKVDDKLPPSGLAKVSFSSYAYAVHENAGSIKLPVVRTGTVVELGRTSTVFFETRSGTARGSEDFVHIDGKLIFEAGETEKFITVEIIDDNVFEEDETFSVVLSTKGNDHNADLANSQYTSCEVTIIDDDKPGTFSFANNCLVVKESEGVAKCVVRRSGGVDGKVKLSYKTKDFTAKKDHDYYHVEGTLLFDHGVNEASFDVVLIDDKRYEKDATFAVEFDIVGFPDCGAIYGDHKVLSITITSDDNYKATVDRVAELMKAHLEDTDIGTGTWMEQLKEALSVECEEGEEPRLLDCILHILSFPWKVVFVLVPPTSYASGYLSFAVSLLFIGGLTTVVGDIATTFGCLIGWPNGLTAITLVALGTSLPDTFASKMAAENDSNADNSIGNITGSNSVNVFLGLGLPWVIAAAYSGPSGYAVKGGASLEISVFVFCILAGIYFALMTFRRAKGWGELGGPTFAKRLTVVALLSMWIFFIVYIYLKVVVK